MSSNIVDESEKSNTGLAYVSSSVLIIRHCNQIEQVDLDYAQIQRLGPHYDQIQRAGPNFDLIGRADPDN